MTAAAVNATKPAVEAVSQGAKSAWNTSEVYLRSAPPRVMEMAAAAADRARPAMTQTTEKMQEAFKAAGPAADKLRRQVLPFVKDLSDKVSRDEGREGERGSKGRFKGSTSSRDE